MTNHDDNYLKETAVTNAQTPATDGAIEQAMAVYRGMTDTEREQVFRSLTGAVADFGRTRRMPV